MLGYALLFFVYFLYATALAYGNFAIGFYIAGRSLLINPVVHFIRPVISDQDLIGRFNQHRDSFEKLVQIHKEKCFTAWSESANSRQEHQEVIELKKRIGLLGVRESPAHLWLPDPYSDATRNLGETLNASTFSRGLSEVEWAKRSLQCPNGSPQFDWEIFPADELVKGVTYFPVDPRVENGKLMTPSYFPPFVSNNSDVLTKLDGLPRGILGMREGIYCAYRKIEPKWFLYVCPKPQEYREVVHKRFSANDVLIK